MVDSRCLAIESEGNGKKVYDVNFRIRKERPDLKKRSSERCKV